MKKIYLVALALASLTANAATHSFKTLSQSDASGVTKESDGVFLVSKDLTVATGDTLVLDNKATVKLASGVTIIIEGHANLAPADTATICSADAENPGKGLQFNGDGTAPMLIKHVCFQTTGIRYVRDAALTVDNCSFISTSKSINSGAATISFVHSNGGNIISHCYFKDCYGAAVAGGANILTGITIDGCVLDNCVTANANRPFLNLTVGGDNPVIVKNNKIYGAKLNKPGAITVANLLSLNGENKVYIQNNYAENCRYGINITGKATAWIEDNVLIDNHYETNANNGGSGITAYLGTVYMTRNRIEGSLWGVTLVGGAHANLGRIDVETTDPEYNPGLNIFANNGNCGTAPEGATSAFDPTKPYDLYNNTPNEVYAQNNHWGVASQTEEEIEKVIFHYNDNANLGKVIFMPANAGDGVDGVNADPCVSATEWYTIDGLKTVAPAVGTLYIRIDTLSDGSRKVTKTVF